MESVLVTGANRGLGLEMVRQYGEDGNWRVYACCRRPGEAEALRRFAATFCDRVSVHRLDVADAGQIRALAAEMSGQSIDILINNAGTYGPSGERFGEADPEVWLHVLRVNTVGPALMAFSFAGSVGRSSRRVMATVSSRMGSLSDNTSGGRYAYRSSKAAANMVMKSLAVDLAERGIVCVALNPGWVRTDMGGPQAPLGPEQSVRGMRSVLAALRPKDSGRWFNHDGAEIPW
ncbi:MAG TPA: SDR family oxidoreductase [Candidatus Polarisedimenticolia bacterium]|nr:SDR family oxidoreductase [Candidatus Polarisedimenticolia bacterium]